MDARIVWQLVRTSVVCQIGLLILGPSVKKKISYCCSTSKAKNCWDLKLLCHTLEVFQAGLFCPADNYNLEMCNSMTNKLK